jgi:hypothetical protein
MTPFLILFNILGFGPEFHYRVWGNTGHEATLPGDARWFIAIIAVGLDILLVASLYLMGKDILRLKRGEALADSAPQAAHSTAVPGPPSGASPSPPTVPEPSARYPRWLSWLTLVAVLLTITILIATHGHANTSSGMLAYLGIIVFSGALAGLGLIQSIRLIITALGFLSAIAGMTLFARSAQRPPAGLTVGMRWMLIACTSVLTVAILLMSAGLFGLALRPS